MLHCLQAYLWFLGCFSDLFIIFVTCITVLSTQFCIKDDVAFAGQFAVAFEGATEKEYAVFQEDFGGLSNEDLCLLP